MRWVGSLVPCWPPNNAESENGASGEEGGAFVGLAVSGPDWVRAGESLRVFDAEGDICVSAPRLRGDVWLADSIEDIEDVRERLEKRELELEVDAKED